MGYTFQESLASLCKNILPFSLRKRRLPSSDHGQNKLQSDNLKWQQDSFHHVLHLINLQKEGIISEKDVSTFRIHLLHTLIGSPSVVEHPDILRDKVVFLQELLYAKCISDSDYHSFKRPLLGRIAAQGAEIKPRDVVAEHVDLNDNSEEYWTDIDLRNDDVLRNKENSKRPKDKPISLIKQNSASAKRKPFKSLFNREKEEKRHRCEAENGASETTPLPLGAKSDSVAYLPECKEKMKKKTRFDEECFENRNPNLYSRNECTVSSSFQNPFWNI